MFVLLLFIKPSLLALTVATRANQQQRSVADVFVVPTVAVIARVVVTVGCVAVAAADVVVELVGSVVVAAPLGVAAVVSVVMCGCGVAHLVFVPAVVVVASSHNRWHRRKW